MGFRYRRSVKIAPGIRLNFNKKSTSISIGGKYGRTTISNTGRVTNTVKTPIKGLSYTETKKISNNTSKPKSNRIIKDGKKRYIENPTVSAKTYRICSFLIRIVAIMFFVIALISLFVFPFLSILVILIAVYLWYISKVWIETAVRMKNF